MGRKQPGTYSKNPPMAIGMSEYTFIPCGDSHAFPQNHLPPFINLLTKAPEASKYCILSYLEAPNSPQLSCPVIPIMRRATNGERGCKGLIPGLCTAPASAGSPWPDVFLVPLMTRCQTLIIAHRSQQDGLVPTLPRMSIPVSVKQCKVGSMVGPSRWLAGVYFGPYS